MNLKRNMCNLPRYAMNCDIQDLASRRQKFFGVALEYASAFWAKHLRAAGTSGDQIQSIVALLREFFQHHLMTWLEVMTLMNELRSAIYSLNDVKGWLLDVSSFSFRRLQ